MESAQTTQRPIRLRARQDLVRVRHAHPTASRWTLKDPVSLRYLEVGEQELAILEWLDGHRSLREIADLFALRYAPQQLPLDQLSQFIARLYRAGLLLSDSPDQAASLGERAARAKRQAFWQSCSNPLAIRWPLGDPQSLLRRIDAVVPRLPASGLWLLLIGLFSVASFVFVGKGHEFWRELLVWQRDVDAHWLLGMAVGLILLKVAHEIGHGLVLQRFGGRCTEAGILLLVFAPCLYVDVSDAWTLPRRQRILVSAAGVLIEWVMAQLALILWALTQPGVLHDLARTVVVLGTINTLVLNGNPLMRYDGYYILSDLVRIPNLWQKAQDEWTRAFRRFLGIPVSHRVPAPRRTLFLFSYGGLSFAYRILVVCVICLWLRHLGRQNHLSTPASGFAMIIASLLVLGPLVGLVAGLSKNPAHWYRIRMTRVTGLALALCGIGLIGWLLPLPSRVQGVAYVIPDGSKPVYAVTPGRLNMRVREGEAVVAGQEIARITNRRIVAELYRIQGERDRLAARLGVLQTQDTDHALAATPIVRQALVDAQRAYDQYRQDVDRLTLRSPGDGFVLTGERKRREPKRTLEGWSDTPLAPHNQGCWVEADTTLCWVGPAERREVEVYVARERITGLQIGNSAKLAFSQLEDLIVHGTVVGIDPAAVERLPALPPAVPLPVERGPEGELLPTSTIFRVVVRLRQPVPLVLGTTGRARIVTQAEPLARLIWRRLRQLF